MIKRTVDDYHKLSGKYLDKFKDLEKKFLITGAAGWLGKATLELLKNVSKDFPNNIDSTGASEIGKLATTYFSQDPAPTSFAAQWNGLAVADRYVASYTSLVVIERR